MSTRALHERFLNRNASASMTIPQRVGANRMERSACRMVPHSCHFRHDEHVSQCSKEPFCMQIVDEAHPFEMTVMSLHTARI